jgi:hypothetical protein
MQRVEVIAFRDRATLDSFGDTVEELKKIMHVVLERCTQFIRSIKTLLDLNIISVEDTIDIIAYLFESTLLASYDDNIQSHKYNLDNFFVKYLIKQDKIHHTKVVVVWRTINL